MPIELDPAFVRQYGVRPATVWSQWVKPNEDGYLLVAVVNDGSKETAIDVTGDQEYRFVYDSYVAKTEHGEPASLELFFISEDLVHATAA